MSMTPDRTSSSPAVWSATDLAGDPHALPDKPDRVRTMFAAIAHRYDLNNRVHSIWRDQAWRRATVRRCRVRPTDQVLDVACGTGDLAEAFAAAGPAAVTGVDFTPEMLDLARQKASRRRGGRWGGRGHAGTPVPDYRWADAQELPFEDGSFDVVSIAFGIRNVADPGRALGEFRRVLRPAGRLAVLEFCEPRSRIMRTFNRLYTQRIMPRTATWLSGDRTGAYRYLPRSIDTFLEPSVLAARIRKAGFDAVDVSRLFPGLCACYIARIEPE